MTAIIPCVAAALALAQPAAEAPLSGPEWPAYKGNAGLTGLSRDDRIRPPFKLVWSYRLDGDASSDAGAGVTVAGGKVFVNIHNTRSILALDARTGRFAWEYNETPIGYMNAPTYVDGRLFLWQRHFKKAALVVVDASTGKELRKQPLKSDGIDPHRAGLPVFGGKVYCSEGGEEPAVTAFAIKDGAQVWRTSLGKEDGTAAVCPIAAGGRIFVATRDHHASKKSSAGATFALDAVNGKILWRRRGIYPLVSLASDGKVVACGMYQTDHDKFHLLDAKTGETIWDAPRRFHYSPATITDDLVLIKPYGTSIFAVDRQTGKERWQFHGKTTSGCCSPVVAGGYAFMGTGVVAPGDLESPMAFQHGHGKESPREKGITGTLHVIDLKTGKSVWRFSTGNTICGEPALAYGRVYFASRDGCVYCFAPAKEGEPTTPEAKDKSEPAPAETIAALLKGPPVESRPVRDWPMLGGTPARAGREMPTLKLPLELAWKLDTGGRILTAAAVRDGKAFVASDGGKIIAVDLKSGKPLWEYAAGADMRCSPAVADDLVYCGSEKSEFHALETAGGKKRWTFLTGGPVRGSPVIVGGVVLFGANDHNLYALDRHTGKKLWTFRAGDYCVSVPPVVHGDRVYCAQWTERVFALDLKTGKELWSSYVPVSVEALAFHRDRLWVRNVHYLVELDPATGKRLRLGNASWGWGGMAFYKNKLYQSGIQSQYGSAGATYTDLDQEGTAMAKVPTMETVLRLKQKALYSYPRLASMGTPLVVGDLVCFAAVSGKVYVTEPDGKERWSYQLGRTCHATPVAADHHLLVGCDDGHLYAFRMK
jgi:outer membrane protein assembly factor BamB